MKSPHRYAPYAVAALLVLVLVPTGLAAKGGNGRSATDPSLSLVTLDSTDGMPHWGQQVTFNVNTNATWPYVEVDCAQGGSWVYAQILEYPFGGQTFTLKSYWWTGGAADCSATLFTTGKNGSRTTLATATFHVDA